MAAGPPNQTSLSLPPPMRLTPLTHPDAGTPFARIAQPCHSVPMQTRGAGPMLRALHTAITKPSSAADAASSPGPRGASTDGGAQSPPRSSRTQGVRIALLIILALGMLELLFLSLRRYLLFEASMLDLGNISQAIWSASRGEPLLYTSFTGPKSRLVGHTELIYFLLAPLYRLLPSPLTLLAFQALLFFLGTIPVYRLARRPGRGRPIPFLPGSPDSGLVRHPWRHAGHAPAHVHPGGP
jgi:hypothetical protein